MRFLFLKFEISFLISSFEKIKLYLLFYFCASLEYTSEKFNIYKAFKTFSKGKNFKDQLLYLCKYRK